MGRPVIVWQGLPSARPVASLLSDSYWDAAVLLSPNYGHWAKQETASLWVCRAGWTEKKWTVRFMNWIATVSIINC